MYILLKFMINRAIKIFSKQSFGLFLFYLFLVRCLRFIKYKPFITSKKVKKISDIQWEKIQSFDSMDSDLQHICTQIIMETKDKKTIFQDFQQKFYTQKNWASTKSKIKQTILNIYNFDTNLNSITNHKPLIKNPHTNSQYQKFEKKKPKDFTLQKQFQSLFPDTVNIRNNKIQKQANSNKENNSIFNTLQKSQQDNNNDQSPNNNVNNSQQQLQYDTQHIQQTLEFSLFVILIQPIMIFTKYTQNLILEKYKQQIQGKFENLLPQSFQIAQFYLESMYQQMEDQGIQNLLNFMNKFKPHSVSLLNTKSELTIGSFIKYLSLYFENVTSVGQIRNKPDRIKRIQNRRLSQFSINNQLRLEKTVIQYTDFHEISQEDFDFRSDLEKQREQEKKEKQEVEKPKNNYDTVFLFLGDILDSKIFIDLSSIENHIQSFDSHCRFQIYKNENLDIIEEEESDKDENKTIRIKNSRSKTAIVVQSPNITSLNTPNLDDMGITRSKRSSLQLQLDQGQTKIIQAHKQLAQFLQKMCLEGVNILQSKSFKKYYEKQIQQNWNNLTLGLQQCYQKKNNNTKQKITTANHINNLKQIISKQFLQDSDDNYQFFKDNNNIQVKILQELGISKQKKNKPKQQENIILLSELKYSTYKKYINMVEQFFFEKDCYPCYQNWEQIMKLLNIQGNNHNNQQQQSTQQQQPQQKRQ